MENIVQIHSIVTKTSGGLHRGTETSYWLNGRKVEGDLRAIKRSLKGQGPIKVVRSKSYHIFQTFGGVKFTEGKTSVSIINA